MKKTAAKTKKETKPKKEKKPKEPIEDHSPYKVEVYDENGQKRVYNFDWQGNME